MANGRRGRPRRPIDRETILAALREAGGSVRRASWTTGIPRSTLTDYLAREPPPPRASLVPQPEPSGAPRPKTWAELRPLLKEVADTLLDECSDVDSFTIHIDFQLEIDTAYRRLQQRARECGKRNISGAPARKKLVNACEVLNVAPPKRGCRFADAAYKTASKNYRALARSYHPDLRGGDDSLRPQYDAVLTAWTAIESYQREHPE